MKKSAIILALALSVSACYVMSQDQGGPPPPGQRPPGGQAGFHLLPPRVREQLNLTDDQQKQVTALEAETKAKLEKILTADQMKQLQQMRPPRRGGGGEGGGPGGDGQGGPPPGGQQQ